VIPDSLAAQLSLPIPTEWVVQGGAVGLLAVVALMVFLGRLVPRRTYDDMVQDRDHWRAIALKAMGHTEALMPAARITTRVTEALGAEVEAALAPYHRAGPQ
jgi:hypothetical protein